MLQRLVALLALMSFGPRPLAAQIHADLIRGRVTTDSGKAIVAAQVIATRAPDRAIFRASTDADGRYEIVVDSGTGDYLVHISLPTQPTWTAVRKRVTRQAPSDTTFTVDATLKAPAPQQLAAVKIEASKPTPDRDNPILGRVDVGASEQGASGVYAQLSPDLRGNILGAASTLPGVTPTAGGFSVMGAGADQNRTTLNGMAFSGASVPRDAQTFTSVATSTFDPSRGWFSGGEASVNLSPGFMFSAARASLSLDAPALQGGDALARHLGRQYSDLQAGLGGDGMAADDKVAYSYGVQATRHAADVPTLTTAASDVLQHAGVARDSVTRLRQLLAAKGIPTSAPGFSGTDVTQGGSLIARINTPLFDTKAMKATKRSMGLIVYAAHNESGVTSVSPLSTPVGGARSSTDGASVQGVFSGFLTPNVLQDVRVAVNVSDARTTPFLQLPSGSVLVNSTFGDSAGGVAGLGFGGGAAASRNRSTTWEAQSETQFYAPWSVKHRLKVNGDLRFDDVSRALDANRFGAFSFNSLGDLAAGRATTFSRTLDNPTRTGSVVNGFVSVGDLYKVTPQLQVLYGLRAEANHYTERPLANPAVEAAFGSPTDAAPDRVHVSPRLGFTWTYTKHPSGYGFMSNGWGIFPQSPSGVIRGGIGEFRSMLSPSLLSEPGARTGLPGGMRSVSCVGDAVPAPDWASYLSSTAVIPLDCVGGASLLRDAAPSVQLVDRSYDAARSWRANLSWTTSVHEVSIFVEGVYSLNLNQPGQQDLNFAGAPRFTLSNEGRPVFVSPTSIVAATGAVSPTDARANAAFGRVLSVGSDLRGEAKQVTGIVSKSDGAWLFSLAYTLQGVRSQQRGFDGSTFGAPTERSWARGDNDVRHSFVLQGGYGFRYVNSAFAGRVSSGRPFTPMVAGDVNGDGSSNDRAFVFDPAKAADPAVATGLRTLLAGAPSNVRDCLLGQLGRPADRNSCEGPWTADLNARVGFNLYRLGEPWRRWNIELFISNPLGGLDQLLHGSNLQGWGNPAAPDPNLLQVVGFDAAAQRFRYTVNPRFGDTRPSNTTARAPFRVTLSARIDIGTPMSAQQLERFLRPGRAGHPGTKLNVADLKKRYARNVQDPYRQILQQSDSLLLQPDQITALKDAQTKYAARVDSVWTALSEYLAALPDAFDVGAAMKRQEDVVDLVWDMGRPEMQAVLPKILTPLQLKMLPWLPDMYMKAKEPIKGIRTFYYGDP